jgi:hypothetical protein
MERTHGWHQRDRGFPGAKAIDSAAQDRNRAGDHGIAWHLVSISWGKPASQAFESERPTLPIRLCQRQAVAGGLGSENVFDDCVVDRRLQRSIHEFVIKAVDLQFDCASAHFS